MFRRRPHGGTPTLLTPDEEYCDLRRRILTLDPTTVGLASVTAPRRMVWGAMVDLVCPDVRATVVSLRDGTTSLYTDIGFSIIGAGSDPEVAARGEELLIELADHVEHLTGDPVLSLPEPVTTVFTSLTVAGPRSRVVATEVLKQERDPMASVLHASHAVLDALEVVHEQRLADV